MSNQRGFSVIEIIIVIVILAVLGGVGYVAWQRLMPKPAATAAPWQTVTRATTDCSATGDVTSASDGTIQAIPWKSITTKQIDLPGMQVSFATPEGLTASAVCRMTESGGGSYRTYAFSTRQIVTNLACEKQYYQIELGDPSVELWQYPGSTPSQGQGSGVDETLDQYYASHKADDGTYVMIGGSRYNRIGNDYYVMFGDTSSSYAQYKDARAAACPDAPADFGAQFTDAFNETAYANLSLPSSTK